MRRASCGIVLALVVLSGCGGSGSDQQRAESPPRAPSAAWCPIDSVGAFNARQLIGLPLDQAMRLAGKRGCSIRLLGYAGDKNNSVTADRQSNRIDVTVAKNMRVVDVAIS